jgi:hypothetical protein
MEVITKEPEETAPVDAPSALPTDVSAPPVGTAPAPSDSWDDVQQLLDEFDQKTATSEPAAADENIADGNNTSTGAGDDLDKWLSELGGGPSPEQQQIQQLTAEINSLREAEFNRHVQGQFDKFSSDLQRECENLDVVKELKAMSVDRPELSDFFRYYCRFNNQDRTNAQRELTQLDSLYGRAKAAPDDPRKAQALAQMEQYGRHLQFIINAPAVVRQVRNEIRGMDRRAPKDIDEIATADRDAVYQAIRDGSTPIIPEAPTRWGNLSAREGREKVKQDYGFDPGWSW